MKKVLFLVYRAGWWGCFDQLYREHKAETGCQCSVVVLPRYERDPETHLINFDRYQYDAGAMPKDVEVTDYRKYSLAQERPDIIYIHNPHDSSNIVDSVHPDYFTQNLKRYTDKLVYVHHTIGFTEKARQYTAYQYVDKIYIPTEKDRYAFPVELDSKLEVVYPGIILYITNQWEHRPVPQKNEPVSLFVYVDFNDLYYGTEKVLRKLEQVLGYLKGRRDFKVTLHSDRELLENFYELHPAVAMEYDRIVRWYVDEKIGEYDISDNDCMTVVKYDVLVSFGWKTISNLFSVLGKACYQLNQECNPLPTEDDLCTPSFWDCSVEGDEVTFVANVLKLLCRMDLKTGKVKVLGEVPDEVDSGEVYANIYKKNNLYFLLPNRSDGLVIYDENNGKFEKTYFPNCVRQGNFYAMIPYEQYFYFLPGQYRGILCYHTENGEYKIYNAWVDEVDHLAGIQNKMDPYFSWGIRQDGHMLHMSSAKASIIMHFDMETGRYFIEKTGIPDEKFCDMEWDNGNTILSSRMSGKIYNYCSEQKQWRIIYKVPEYDTPNLPYEKCLDMGGKIVFFPRQADSILIWKKDSGTVEESKDVFCCGQEAYQSEYMKTQTQGCQVAKKMDDEHILIYERYTGTFHLLDKELYDMRKIKCRPSYSDVILCYKHYCNRSRVRYQSLNVVPEWHPIPVMLEYLKTVCRDREMQKENRQGYLSKNYY